jgi:hypothetical protein
MVTADLMSYNVLRMAARGVQIDPQECLVQALILEDAPRSEETALLSEQALADWTRPEEDAAWSHLQPAG